MSPPSRSARVGKNAPLALCGLLALVFFAVHAAAHLARGTPEGILWVCHVSNLLIGAGLLGRNATLNAIGLLILMVGVPLWLLNLVSGGTFLATSLLTHVGGPLLALLGVRRLGWPRPVWFRSLIVVAALTSACIWWTPPGTNVNLAFHGPAVERIRVHPGVYLMGLLLFWGWCLWLTERLVARWLPAAGSQSR